MPTFTPPTVESPRLAFDGGLSVSAERLFRRVVRPETGVAVWRDSGGVWHQGRPSMDDEADASVLYHGGHVHTVTAAEKTALEAAGYTVDP